MFDLPSDASIFSNVSIFYLNFKTIQKNAKTQLILAYNMKEDD